MKKHLQVTRTVEFNGSSLAYVNYPIISITIMNEFFQNYREITGETTVFCEVPPWFYFEGPQNRSNIPEEFEVDCIRIVGPTHYFRMKKLYEDIKSFNSMVNKTITRARELYGQIYEYDFNF